MTPLRREVRIPIYWLIVGIAVMLISPILCIVLSVRIADSNLEKTQRTQQAAQAAAVTQAKKVVCDWIATNLDVFEEQPPSTETGRKLKAKYLGLYDFYSCQPPRK